MDDLSGFSMQELFRVEADNQGQVLTQGLLELEKRPDSGESLELCMRAAHSIKGAARIVNLQCGVDTAHAMEDCFVAMQKGSLKVSQEIIDVLLRGVDMLLNIGRCPDLSAEELGVAGFLADLERSQAKGGELPRASASEEGVVGRQDADTRVEPPEPSSATSPAPPAAGPQELDSGRGESSGNMLRVSADNLNHLLALAGESLVESRKLQPFTGSLLRIKRLHHDLRLALEQAKAGAPDTGADGEATPHSRALEKLLEIQRLLAERLEEFEHYDRRVSNLAERVYSQTLACRMLPFSDGIRHFPRLARDLSKKLGKRARLLIVGEHVRVDRDILEKMEASLNHLIHNALDHGLESPEERVAAGKQAEGTVSLMAVMNAGSLQIVVADDGRGIDVERVRRIVAKRKLTSEGTAAQLSEAELLEFLFLPGFTLREEVTQISGRGVGLDIVQNMARGVRGMARVTTKAGKGTRFELRLPLTLSVVRALVASVGGEAYAFPLPRIGRALKISRKEVESIQGRQHFEYEGRRIGLVEGSQVLGLRATGEISDPMSVVVLGEQGKFHGLVVDKFLGEHELVIQELDARLGKIQDVSAGSILEDGTPVLIVDTQDLAVSIDKMASSGGLSWVGSQETAVKHAKRKRVLVVEDSLTVRELERKLLSQSGYEVEIAMDGMDGWNAVRSGRHDLVLTDVDMPRMDGIELARLIKADPRLKSIPVMIVSYKDREEDRRRGLEAGADYYLTKGSFHDDTLIKAVVDLIGEAGA